MKLLDELCEELKGYGCTREESLDLDLGKVLSASIAELTGYLKSNNFEKISAHYLQVNFNVFSLVQDMLASGKDGGWVQKAFVKFRLIGETKNFKNLLGIDIKICDELASVLQDPKSKENGPLKAFSIQLIAVLGSLKKSNSIPSFPGLGFDLKVLVAEKHTALIDAYLRVGEVLVNSDSDTSDSISRNSDFLPSAEQLPYSAYLSQYHDFVKALLPLLIHKLEKTDELSGNIMRDKIEARVLPIYRVCDQVMKNKSRFSNESSEYVLLIAAYSLVILVKLKLEMIQVGGDITKLSRAVRQKFPDDSALHYRDLWLLKRAINENISNVKSLLFPSPLVDNEIVVENLEVEEDESSHLVDNEIVVENLEVEEGESSQGYCTIS